MRLQVRESCLPQFKHVVDVNKMIGFLQCATMIHSRRLRAWGKKLNSLVESNRNGPRNINAQSVQQAYLNRLNRNIIRDSGNEPQLRNNVKIELTIVVLYRMNLS